MIRVHPALGPCAYPSAAMVSHYSSVSWLTYTHTQLLLRFRLRLRLPFQLGSWASFSLLSSAYHWPCNMKQ